MTRVFSGVALAAFTVIVAGTSVSVILANLVLDFLAPLQVDEIWIGHGAWASANGIPADRLQPSYLPNYLGFLAGFVTDSGLEWFVDLRRITAACYVTTVLGTVVVARMCLHKVAGQNGRTGGFWYLAVVGLALAVVGLQRGLEIRPEPLTMPLFVGAWLALAYTSLKQHRSGLGTVAAFAIAGGLLGVGASVALRLGFVGAGLLLGYAVQVALGQRLLALYCLAAAAVAGGLGMVLAVESTSGIMDLVAFFQADYAAKPPAPFWAKLTKEATATFLRPVLLGASLLVFVALVGVVGRASPGGDRWPGRMALLLPLALAWVGIAVDPDPFEYAFIYPGIALVVAIGVLLGSAPGGEGRWLWRTAVMAVCIAGIVPHYLGRELNQNIVDPDDGRLLPRLLATAPVQDLETMSLEDLVAELHRLRHAAWGMATLRQSLPVSEALCRRLEGEEIVATVKLHPVCVRDATYFWAIERWREIYIDRPAGPGGQGREFTGFQDIEARKPALILEITPRDGAAFRFADHLSPGFLSTNYLAIPQGYVRRDLADPR